MDFPEEEKGMKKGAKTTQICAHKILLLAVLVHRLLVFSCSFLSIRFYLRFKLFGSFSVNSSISPGFHSPLSPIVNKTMSGLGSFNH
jgi:hypothetical protein